MIKYELYIDKTQYKIKVIIHIGNSTHEVTLSEDELDGIYRRQLYKSNDYTGKEFEPQVIYTELSSAKTLESIEKALYKLLKGTLRK